MKVKIMYSADFEDLPKEVSNIMNSPVMKLQDLANSLGAIVRDLRRPDVNVEMEIKSIQEFVTESLKAIGRIDDCMGILVGMTQVLKEQEKGLDSQQKEVKEAKEALSDS